MLAALELEDRREQLAAEPLLLEPRGDRVDCRHLIDEVGVADDDPRVAERVLAPLQPGARLRRHLVEQLLEVVLRPDEVTGGERLEADRRPSRRLQAELDLAASRPRS